MRRVLVSDLIDLDPDGIKAAKHRLFWTGMVLRSTEPIVISGCVDSQQVDPSKRSLLELLTDRKLGTTAWKRTVGFVIYMPRRSGGRWEVRRFVASTGGTLTALPHPRHRFLFRTKDEAWTFCNIWYEFDRLNSTFSGFLQAIQEPPLHAVPLRKEESALTVSLLTQDEVEAAEEARIMFEARRKPALAKLCRERGLDAEVDAHDPELQEALTLDSVRITGLGTPPPPGTDSAFMKKFKTSMRCYQRRPILPTPTAKQAAREDLVNNWIFLGFIFLGKSALADLINRKHGTHYSAAAIAATCRRLNLIAKRPLCPLEELSEKMLSKILKNIFSGPKDRLKGSNL